MAPADNVDPRDGDIAVHPRAFQPPPPGHDGIGFLAEWQAIEHIDHHNGMPAAPQVGQCQAKVGVQKGGKRDHDRVGWHGGTWGKGTCAVRMPFSGIESGVKQPIELMAADVRGEPARGTAQHDDPRTVTPLQHRLHQLGRSPCRSLGRGGRRAGRLRVRVDEYDNIGGSIGEPVGDM